MLHTSLIKNCREITQAINLRYERSKPLATTNSANKILLAQNVRLSNTKCNKFAAQIGGYRCIDTHACHEYISMGLTALYQFLDMRNFDAKICYS